MTDYPGYGAPDAGRAANPPPDGNQQGQPQYGDGYGQDQPQPGGYGQGQQPGGYGQDQPQYGGYGQGQQPGGYGQDQPQYGLPQAPPVAAGYGYGQVGQMAAPPGMYFDPQSGLMLPDGTELASVGRRIGAYFLSIGLMIVTLVIGYLIWGAIRWSKGQGPAMQVLGLRVWRPDTGRVATFGWMALRDIIGRFVEGLFFIWVVSFILMCAGKQRRTIHDYIGGTVVLRDADKLLEN
jgi:uncharacterized RDD family membrane protein YckC